MKAKRRYLSRAKRLVMEAEWDQASYFEFSNPQEMTEEEWEEMFPSPDRQSQETWDDWWWEEWDFE